MARSRRRRLGQNFLTDRRVVAAIVEQLTDEPNRVVEIGPGRGILTTALAERFSKVLALELDEQLLPGLEARFPDGPVELRYSDALTEPLEPLLGDEAPWQVAANLPYSVGTAILRRLLPRHDLFSRLVVMLQREVAERVVAVPGARGHGLLALERAAHAEARIAFDVPPSAFRPRPRVTSSVVVLDLRPPAFDAGEIAWALKLAARALTMPRKMLSNALRGVVGGAALEAAEIPPEARPGTIPLEAWVRLAVGTTGREAG
jgi:16S rRNA (adenine1518-N6/adenine1519-N6)-dimethyltransferase